MMAVQSFTLPSLLLATLSAFFILGTQVSNIRAATAELPSHSTSNNKVVIKQKSGAGTSLKAPLPDFAHIYNTQEKKQQFFSYLSPIITSVNKSVAEERRKIETRQNTLKNKKTLSSSENKDLSLIAKKYRVDTSKGFDATFFVNILNKVDQIPPSLVLAQAANESAWGTSRFAIKGNNLFGQWCFSKGCGLVPTSRNNGANHEVAKFKSVFDSVKSYVLNLNRHAEYKKLRAIRTKNRQANKPISGIDLANGLEGYSERGLDYVKEIKSMIRFNNLSSLDKHTQYK